MGVALLLHSLFAVIWVGGMFFALMCLRPAAAELEPDNRMRLWAGVLQHFFPWILVAMLVLMATGLWMTFAVLGGFKEASLSVHVMFGLGTLMMLLGLHAYFAPMRRLRRLVAEGHWAEAGKNLRQLRLLLVINLILGLLVVATASGGRYLLR